MEEVRRWDWIKSRHGNHLPIHYHGDYPHICNRLLDENGKPFWYCYNCKEVCDPRVSTAVEIGNL